MRNRKLKIKTRCGCPFSILRFSFFIFHFLFSQGCDQEERAPVKAAKTPAKAVEAPVKYKLVRTFESGLDPLRGIAIDANDRIFLAGRSRVRVLDAAGNEVRSWATSGPARCVAVDAEGNVYVGLATKVERYDPAGKLLTSWGKKGKGRGELRMVTAIAVRGSRVYVADAGNRCVHRFDFTGDFINEIGKRDAEANFEPHQFTGCCNPTNIVLMSGGRVATAEKVVPRVKVYDREGRMLAYLGPEFFSAKAAGLDLAVDSRGRLHVIDPGSGKVHVFAREE
jgi:streptogramin lyase